MKKFLFLVLVILFLASTAIAEYDSDSIVIELQPGWYQIVVPGALSGIVFHVEDRMLITKYEPAENGSPEIIEAADEKASVKHFTLIPGFYIAGEDFPSGVYSIRAGVGTSLVNIWVYNEKNSLIFTDGFWGSEKNMGDSFLGKIELLDGYTIKISNGDAFFSDPVGPIFD